MLRHDDVIKWKHLPRYRPFVWGIHRSPVNSQHKSQWHRALMFSLIWNWINRRVNNCEAGDLRRHRIYYDISVMYVQFLMTLTEYNSHLMLTLDMLNTNILLTVCGCLISYNLFGTITEHCFYTEKAVVSVLYVVLCDQTSNKHGWKAFASQ